MGKAQKLRASNKNKRKCVLPSFKTLEEEEEDGLDPFYIKIYKVKFFLSSNTFLFYPKYKSKF